MDFASIYPSYRSTHPTILIARVEPALDGRGATLFRRRDRPRLLRAAQAFERLGHAEHAEIVEAAADDLHADRETFAVVTAIERDRGIFGHIPRHGKADVLERLVGVVDRRGEFGREVHDWRHR